MVLIMIFMLFGLLSFYYYYSGLESMGEEIKINGRFGWRRVQTDGLCWWGSNWETYNFEARQGMDRAIAALSCAFKFLQRAPQSLGLVQNFNEHKFYIMAQVVERLHSTVIS